MSGTFEEQKRWEESFTEAFANVARECLPVSVASIEQDRECNTDLVLRVLPELADDHGQPRIACRVRHWQYKREFSEDFTIRAKVPSGAKTEIDKIRDGYCSYFIYALAPPWGPPNQFWMWYWCDQHVLRTWLLACERKYQRTPGALKHNVDKNGRPDGTAFYVFKFKDLPGDFILKQYPERPCHRRAANIIIPPGSHVVRSRRHYEGLASGTCASCDHYNPPDAYGQDTFGCAAGVPVDVDRDVHAAIWCRFYEPRNGET